jgi:hypothetical protein
MKSAQLLAQVEPGILEDFDAAKDLCDVGRILLLDVQEFHRCSHEPLGKARQVGMTVALARWMSLCSIVLGCLLATPDETANGNGSPKGNSDQLAGERHLVFQAADAKAVRWELRARGYALPPAR